MGVDVGTLELEFVAKASQLEAQMASLRKQLATDVADLQKKMGSVKGFDGLVPSARKAGAAINSLSGQTGNIAAQFQDIAVQLQGGGSPFTIALQQGTQLGAIFTGAGGLGTAVKGVGAAFMSMLSPVNLVTIGLIAAGGAAVKYFMGKDDADAMTEALKKQPEIINAIRNAWGEAAAQAAGFGYHSGESLTASIEQQKKVLEKGVSDVTAATSKSAGGTTDFQDAISNIVSATASLNGAGADLPKGMQALKDAVAALNAEAGDPTAVFRFVDAMSSLSTAPDTAAGVKTLAESLLGMIEPAKTAAERLWGYQLAQKAAKDAQSDLMTETKQFNTLMSQGLYGEAAQHAQQLGQALSAAAAAQRALNKALDPASFGPGDLGVGPHTNMTDPRLSGQQMRGLADRWQGRENTVFSETGMFSESSFSPAAGILDLIAQAEGTANRRGYNETLDFGRWTGGNRNLTAMTLADIDKLQTGMLANPDNRALYGNGRGSSALGRYQFTRDTLRDLRSSLGIKEDEYFTPEMQDRLAAELVRRTGGDVGKLRGRWEGLNRVGDTVISAAVGNSASTMPAQDPALAGQQRAYDDLIKSGQRYIAEQQQEAATFGLTAEQASRLRLEQQMLNQLTASGVPVTEAQRRAIHDLAGQMAAAGQASQDLARHSQDVASAQEFIAQSGSEGLIDMIVNGRDAADVMLQLAKSIETAVLQAALLGQGPLAGLFGTSSSSGGLGGLFGWLFGGSSTPNYGSLGVGTGGLYANGGVPGARGLHRYVNSVVDRPTTFAFAAGAGLMGEAGPEAIMPLTRDGAGRLGVRAAGGSGSVYAPSFNVSLQASGNRETDAAMAKRLSTELQTLTANAQLDFVARESRPGGVLNRRKFT